MNLLYRVIYLLLAFLSLVAIYFGAIQPFLKTYYLARVSAEFKADHLYRSFIEASERALAFSSPQGHEETLYFVGSQTFSLLQDDDIGENVARPLTVYYESWFDARRPLAGGVFYTQGFSVAGQLRHRLWDLYGDTDDFSKAEYYYREGLRFAPDKPDFLYDLFRLYFNDSAHSDDARVIGERILELWPEDTRVRDFLITL